MGKIKVYLQYPWKFPDSPYYKYLIDNPPENINYLNVKKQKGVITSKKKLHLSNLLKRTIRRTAGTLNLPLPNLHLTKTKERYDLIHCAHCLSLNKQLWVADFEDIWQFSVSGKQTRTGKKLILKILERPYCKKIIAWTKESKSNIAKEFPEIKNKIEIVYPAVPLPRIKRIKHKGINLLFVGRYFFDKGGLHVLKAFDILTKKYRNINCFVVSEIPENIFNKYSSNKKIKFFGLMSHKRLFKEIYAKSDLFVYPGYSDSFGFSILESMSLGIPVVTAGGFARKEIVDEGKTGFIVETPWEIKRKLIGKNEDQLIQKIVEKTEKLIKNTKLRKKMSKNCLNIIKTGKFSIGKRNKKLKKIYEGVLK
jgi:glycosyltransferase involved in cell wall biosynthesis